MRDDTTNQKSKPDFSPCFIHSALDKYGLTPVQFRVFCKISSRGECFESARTMAKGCKMNADTLWAAIKFLESNRLITRKVRFGQTSILTINPVSQWKQLAGKEGAPERRGHHLNQATVERNSRGTLPAERRGHKLNPFELDPIKETTGETFGFASKGDTSSQPGCNRPTLKMIESWMEAAAPGSTAFAQVWLRKMEQQNWCDGENRPVQNWTPLAAAYAKACMRKSAP